MNTPGWCRLERLVGAAALLASTGCGAEPLGKCGDYVDTVGTARITSIRTAPAGQNNCLRDPVQVLFDFTPTAFGRGFLAATGVPLTIGSGQNPPRGWIAAAGIAVDTELPVTRSDQAVGPCSPVTWTFTSVSEGAGLAACY